MNSLERCIAAIRGEKVDRVPVFPLLMFFAQNRYDITYREFATNGRALAEAQMSIREKFTLDAITACSDAFRITADLGAEMAFPEDKPPYAAQPLVRTESDFKRLKRVGPDKAGSRMADRSLGVKVMADAIGKECLVLGWVDMPFAEACSVCGVSDFMFMLMDNPVLAHSILSFLTDIVIDFSIAQLQAGAPMIGAGDAAASLVSADLYREFVLPYEQKVVKAIHAAGGLVKLHICGETSHLLIDMIRCGADLFNVDHLVDFRLACETYGKANVCFKGNLNPVADMMQATAEECMDKCTSLIKEAKGLRYMLSPGCEVPAQTPDEVFRSFCESTSIITR